MSRKVELLTQREILDMMAKVGRGRTAIRNRAAMAVMWRSGLRVSEVCDLSPRDCDLKGLTIRVRHGKGDKSRTVGMDQQTAAYLALWLAEREKHRIRGDFLFCTLRSTRVSRQYWHAMLVRLARRAGIEKRMHPHALRHAFARELAEENAPLVHIQRLLGHASLNTTVVYLESLGLPATLNVVRGRSFSERDE